MKQFLITLIFLTLSILSFSQCVVEHWDLSKKVAKSELIIEGKVISTQGVWEANRGNIYTLNTIEVYKVFKGETGVIGHEIILATEGGIVDQEALVVSPSLELAQGEIGLFLVRKSTVQFETKELIYKPTASIQSFISYDMSEYKAYDYQKTYNSITSDLYKDLKKSIGANYIEVKSFNTKRGRGGIVPLAPPVISSLSVSNLTSGTETELTITGSNFGLARGDKGKVGFKDANFGDGRYYYTPTGWSYTSWSNSQIKILVPSRAGTGKIEVTNIFGESSESSTELTVDWSHLNVIYPLSNSDTPFFELKHVDDNTVGGYTWQMNPNFANKSQAVSSLLRSLEEWRCETKINWEVGVNTNIDTILNDDVNIVRFTEFSDSKLGVCYSRYRGCFTNGGQSMDWYVSELDIEFDSTINWYYGTDQPAFSEYDFQSVTTHELGHGHQLGHVRDDSKVMHYSLTNGQRKANLVTSDINAGNYISDKSLAAKPCNQRIMIAVKSGECTITEPLADFETSQTSVCEGTSILISNTTKGSVQSYLWDFGVGASPATADTEGPHTIRFDSAGTRTIRLIATNNIGSDTVTYELLVKPTTLDSVSKFVIEDSACLGEYSYTVDVVEYAENYTWNISNGGEITEDLGNSVKINWKDTGIQTISVFALNSCVDGPARESSTYIMDEPIAQFSESIDGIEVSFTNESTQGETYLWTFGDGATSSEASPMHRFIDQGEYESMLSVTNRCGNDEVEKDFNLAYNVSVNELNNHTRIYPNPLKAGEEITVEGRKYDTFKLHSLDGRIIESNRMLNNRLKLDMNTPAVYLLTLQNSTEEVHFRLQIIE